MHVVVTIVSYGSGDDIVECLEALSGSTDPDFSVEICENGGPAKFEALAQALAGASIATAPAAPVAGATETRAGRLPGGQQIRLHLSPDNSGYAGGVNRCIKARDGTAWELLWILNPDARPTPDSLARMREHLTGGGYDIVGARLVLSATRRVQLYGGRWRRLMARGYNIGLNQPIDHKPDVAEVERQLDYVHGACMLATRAFVERSGPMDPDYFLYCEEVDWCLRDRSVKLGYAHEALVYHDHGSTIGSSVNRRLRSRLAVYLDERNRLMLTRRRFPAIYPIVLVATLVLTSQYLVKGAYRNFGHALSGWWAGLRGETGRPGWLEAKTPGA